MQATDHAIFASVLDAVSGCVEAKHFLKCLSFPSGMIQRGRFSMARPIRPPLDTDLFPDFWNDNQAAASADLIVNSGS